MTEVVEDAVAVPSELLVAVPSELLKCLVDAAQHGEHPEGDPACVREVKLLIGSLIPWSGHKLRFEIRKDGVTAELICPATCEPVERCGECGRHREDPPTVSACLDCPDQATKQWPACWLATWAENEDLREYLHDDESIKLTVNIEAEFEDDGPIISVVRDDGTGVTT